MKLFIGQEGYWASAELDQLQIVRAPNAQDFDDATDTQFQADYGEHLPVLAAVVRLKEGVTVNGSSCDSGPMSGEIFAWLVNE